MSKMKALVLYGGRSTEHEISCRSASYIYRHIDRSLFDVYAIAIDKQGRWLPQNREMLEKLRPDILPVNPGEEADAASKKLLAHIFETGTRKDELVVFNILHGTYGEDGCTQGFLDMQGIAYVGPGTLGSALAMDKVVAKKLVAAAGVPVVPYLAFRADEWHARRAHIVQEIAAQLRFPIFVKPASLGSSVGIRKVGDKATLEEAIVHALSFDEKILIETGLEVREIEYACLGGYEPKISQPGEVGVASGFYSYEEKYSSASKAEVKVPAVLDPELREEGKDLTARIYRALNLYGLARIDLFLTRQEQKFYFNEANTLPGFTSISQYPQLWEHSGYKPMQLVSELLELAISRHRHLGRLHRSV